MDLIDDIVRLGGLAPTFALLGAGWTSHQLTSAVRRGLIVRVRQGWYARPGELPHRLQAARVGGRLTCSIGARDLGLWTRTIDPPLHLAVGPHASRLRNPVDQRLRRNWHDPAIVHWDAGSGGSRFVVDPIACLLDMVHCEPLESVVAAADCAIASGLISRGAWMRALAGLPGRLARPLGRIDPSSGSYWESVTRFRLGCRNIQLRTQVQLGVGLRVDFVIGRSLVIEIDGGQHSEREQFETDRERDARLSILDMRCLRFTARQVRSSWPQVLAAIESAIGRGDHL
ncbi:type IV toxin-antitoxin system AbiEi family antitoxin domain-containing protein [soil metagenome]